VHMPPVIRMPKVSHVGVRLRRVPLQNEYMEVLAHSEGEGCWAATRPKCFVLFVVSHEGGFLPTEVIVTKVGNPRERGVSGVELKGCILYSLLGALLYTRFLCVD
jgi:hypothetical protein